MAVHESGPWKKYREEILARLKANPSIVYGKIQKQHEQPNGWVAGLCPFKKDTTPSFGWNKEHLGYACFHPGCGRGSVFDFMSNLHGIDFKSALTMLGDQLGLDRPHGTDRGRPPIRESLVDELHEALMSNEKCVEDICERRGLNERTLRDVKIGWAVRQKRYAIPVRSPNGTIANFRLYSPTKKQKMLNYTVEVQGEKVRYGNPARLFGAEQLASRPGELVWITEGEWDAILLRQHGALAVSGTHGCGTFLPEWIDILQGRDIVLCYDCDTEGKNAVTNVVLPMLRVGWEQKKIKSVKVLMLPLDGNKTDKDITDYFLKRGYEYHALEKRAFDTPPVDFAAIERSRLEQFAKLEEAAKEPPVPLASFREIDRTDLIGRRVSCDITVSGEATDSYFATEQFEVVSCAMRERGMCNICQDPIDIPHGARDFIGSCQQSDNQVSLMLARNYCDKGMRPLIRPTKKRTIREFFCHQRVHRIMVSSVAEVREMERERDGKAEPKPQPTPEEAKRIQDEKERRPDLLRMVDEKNEDVVEKRVYYLADDIVGPGHYRAEGWVIDRPQSQQSSFLIEKLEPQEDDYQTFRVDKSRADLDAFCAMSVEDIFADLRDNVTKVWERDEILAAVLLTYLSPRWFIFKDELLRGWICMAIVGDVGTGKTKTFQKIAEFLDVGDTFSGLTGSRTGLAYAIIDHKRSGWQISPGRYPANSRKILMVDEVQMAEPTDLSIITTAMAEGVLKVDRVVKREYESQTRVVFIGNPRSNRQLDNYTLGCQSLKHTFPQMFLRRLDFVVLANLRDVKQIESILFDANRSLVPHNLTREMLRAAVFLMWNMPPTGIVIDQTTTEVVLNQARVLSHKFGNATDLPLVTMYEIDKKLARLACSYAALDGSFANDYTRLIVKPEHVEMVAFLLNEWYSAENFQLDLYSARRHEADEVTNYGEIMTEIDRIADREKHTGGESGDFFKRLMYSIWSSGIEQDGQGREVSLGRNDICDMTGLSPRYVTKQMRVLKGFNLVSTARGRGGGYTRTAKFSRFMRLLMRERPEFFNGTVKHQIADDRSDDAPDDERDDRGADQTELDMDGGDDDLAI